jgi:uncharacterized membrane protein YeaQ/YmgE (transglycosylase-associated protein family)
LGEGENMNSRLWIVGELGAGWLSGKSLDGNGYGPSMDGAKGIGGAVVGGLLVGSAGIFGYGRAIVPTLVAIICAVLLTKLAGQRNGRRIYARAGSSW